MHKCWSGKDTVWLEWGLRTSKPIHSYWDNKNITGISYTTWKATGYAGYTCLKMWLVVGQTREAASQKQDGTKMEFDIGIQFSNLMISQGNFCFDWIVRMSLSLPCNVARPGPWFCLWVRNFCSNARLLVSTQVVMMRSLGVGQSNSVRVDKLKCVDVNRSS